MNVKDRLETAIRIVEDLQIDGKVKYDILLHLSEVFDTLIPSLGASTPSLTSADELITQKLENWHSPFTGSIEHYHLTGKVSGSLRQAIQEIMKLYALDYHKQHTHAVSPEKTIGYERGKNN